MNMFGTGMRYLLTVNSSAYFWQSTTTDGFLAQKCFKGLPLKFHGESNGAIKIFGYKIFNLHFTGSGTGSDVIDVGIRLFKALTDYTASLNKPFAISLSRILICSCLRSIWLRVCT